MSDTELIKRYFEYANAEDWTALRGLFHEDAALTAVGARPRRGIDDVMSYYDTVFAHWPQHHDEPGRVIGSSAVLAVEIFFSGTGADGRTIEFDAIDVFDIDGGKIKALSSWYDVGHVRRVLTGPPR